MTSLTNIAQLSKKERAKLLFDPDRLRRKVSEALEILDFSSSSHGSDNDDDNDLRPHVPVTPRSKQAIASLPTPQSQPHSTSHTSSPPLSPSPTPTSSFSVAPISELATLPISQIIALIESGGAKSYGIDAVSSEKRQESVKFMDELEGAGQEGVDEKKAVREVKQKLGERLFKVLKTLGIKGAVSPSYSPPCDGADEVHVAEDHNQVARYDGELEGPLCARRLSRCPARGRRRRFTLKRGIDLRLKGDWRVEERTGEQVLDPSRSFVVACKITFSSQIVILRYLDR
jgi:hypothetical protein